MENANFESVLSGREFFNGLQEGIWVADGRGRIVFANNALASLLGYRSPGALVGRDWRDLFPAQEATCIVKTQPRNDVRQVEDSTIISRDSQPLAVSVALTRRIANGATWYLGSVVATRRAAAGSTSVDSTSRQVMDNSTDGICIIRDGKVGYVNPRFEALTGYNSQQMAGIGLERLFVPADRERVARAVADPSRMLAPVDQAVRLITRSAHEVDCQLRIATAESNGGTLLVAFLRDISELRRAEQARTDFIAVISHELRTPLAAIKEAVSLVADNTGPTMEDRPRRYLAIAQEEIARLNRMISNLLETARVESGKLQLDLHAIGLRDVINKTVESFSMFVSKKRIAVEMLLPDDLPPVLGDADRLRLVFNNLFDNAIKYTPAGSTIRVSAQPLEPDAPVMSEDSLLPDTPYVQVTVADSGPGIPAEFLDRVFGKYERVDPHGPGIGLGLAIVRSIIEMHHGKVWVRSNLGEGTSFNLILPVKETR
jgi:two-component system phosphate regulon sensor histidine kinase PhoR